jgi:hypothetical protein
MPLLPILGPAFMPGPLGAWGGQELGIDSRFITMQNHFQENGP